MVYSRFNPKSTSDFVQEAQIFHGNFYDYSLSEYKNYYTFVNISCPEHGVFSIRPDHHIKGAKCPKCRHADQRAVRSLGNESFIFKAKELHGEEYQYDKVHYINAHTKVIIVCPKHGDFEQQPRSHLYQKAKCPRCSKSGSSKIEQDWLDHIDLPNSKDHRRVRLDIGPRTMIVDGFDSKTNTVYEFHGDFWHGNPEVYNSDDMNQMTLCSFGELYYRTKLTEDLIRTAGYNLVVCWEKDFKHTTK